MKLKKKLSSARAEHNSRKENKAKNESILFKSILASHRTKYLNLLSSLILYVYSKQNSYIEGK